MISGEIRRFLRDDGMIKVSRSLKELAYRAGKCRETLQEQLGREPTVCELAQNLQVDEEELTMALEAGSEVESLHRPVFQSEGQEVRLMDKLPQEKEQEEQIVNYMLLSQLLTGLEKEERRLLYLRYFAEKTQTQVGKELGISQVQVSRMEKRILQNLREQI